MTSETNPSGEPQRLERPDGHTIAYRKTAAQATGPGVVWLSGFKSDMAGTKAAALAAWAERTGRAYTRFDYFGHGRSSGTFAEGTVSRWLGDALAVLDQLTVGPQVLVGSSMGGWIATLAALQRPARVKGLLLIAPAADFTEALIWQQAPDEVKRAIMERGVWERPSAYDPDPYPITRGLIEDGRKHLILGGAIDVRCPVRVLHGMADPDVPWTHGMRLVERLASADVVVQLVKSGDHRLSTPADLERMCAVLEELVASWDRRHPAGSF
jgi:pimeloyl-ACP methyl ester carboxylesterase